MVNYQTAKLIPSRQFLKQCSAAIGAVTPLLQNLSSESPRNSKALVKGMVAGLRSLEEKGAHEADQGTVLRLGVAIRTLLQALKALSSPTIEGRRQIEGVLAVWLKLHVNKFTSISPELGPAEVPAFKRVTNGLNGYQDESINKVRAFVRKYGHAEVPYAYDMALCAWVSAQRRMFKYRRLSPEKLATLVKVGVLPEPTQGERRTRLNQVKASLRSGVKAPATEPETKCCSKCRQEKPIEEFALRNDAAVGRHSQCKLCHNQGQMRRYREKQDQLALGTRNSEGPIAW